MKIPRLPWDSYWMLMAHLVATRSTCDRGPELLLCPGRHGTGTVLVKNKRAIATGYNGSAPGQPHCSDPEDYLRCKSCGTKFGGEIDSYVGGDTKAVCLTCNACTFVDRKKGGHEMVDGHCVRTIHSESNAIIQCALDGVSPHGATLYCTTVSCHDCTKMIIRAGIKHVVFAKHYESRYGKSGESADLLQESGINVSTLILSRGELGIE